MGIHISDDVGSYARIAHGVAHYAKAALVLRCRLRHVVSIAAHAVARDLREDASAALAGEFQLFQDHDARAFADHEAVAISIPRTAGLLGGVVAGRQSAHGGESANAHGSDCGLRAPGNHHVGIVVLDDAVRISDGMCASGTGRRGRLVRSLGPVAHRDLPGCKIDDGSRNEEWRNLAGPSVHQRGVFAFDDVEPSDPRPDVNADPLVVLRSNLQFRHFHRFLRGRDRDMNEASHFLDFFFFDEVQRVEVLDLGGNLAGKSSRVETGDAPDAALACKQGLPHHVSGIAHATDQAQACDYDPASQLFPRFRVFADVVHRVLHRADFLGVFVGDLDVEGFFESHDQFDGVQRVRAQVVHERRAGGDFPLIHSQLLHDNLFYLLVYGCHVFPRLPRLDLNSGSSVALSQLIFLLARARALHNSGTSYALRYEKRRVCSVIVPVN